MKEHQYLLYYKIKRKKSLSWTCPVYKGKNQLVLNVFSSVFTRVPFDSGVGVLTLKIYKMPNSDSMFYWTVKLSLNLGYFGFKTVMIKLTPEFQMQVEPWFKEYIYILFSKPYKSAKLENCFWQGILVQVSPTTSNCMQIWELAGHHPIFSGQCSYEKSKTVNKRQ